MIASESHDIVIEAPVKVVFDWIAYSPNLVDVWPNLVKSVEFAFDSDGLGYHKTIYMMAGIQITVESKDTLRIPNKKIISVSETGIKNTLTWTFSEVDQNKTSLVLTAEYEAPRNVLGKMSTGLVLRLNQRDLIALLKNLKIKIEGLNSTTI